MDPALRHAAVTLHEAGLDSKSIANQLGTSQRSVQRWIKRKREGESLEDHPRSGRPSKYLRVKAAIKQALKSKEHGSVRRAATKVSNEVEAISKSTVHRIGRQVLDLRAVSSKPKLTKKQQEARVAFASKLLRTPKARWSRVVFTDEKVFHIGSRPRKAWVEKGTKPAPRETVKHPGKIMVHGAITGLGQLSLVRVEGKLNAQQLQEMLQDDVVPAATELLGNDWVFQQDSTEHGVHGAKSLRDWLGEHVPRYLRPWPAQSPDLNPIEHVWAKLTRDVNRREPSTVDELWAVMQDEWRKLDPAFLLQLTQSMTRRLRAVLDADGGTTKY